MEEGSEENSAATTRTVRTVSEGAHCFRWGMQRAKHLRARGAMTGRRADGDAVKGHRGGMERSRGGRGPQELQFGGHLGAKESEIPWKHRQGQGMDCRGLKCQEEMQR